MICTIISKGNEIEQSKNEYEPPYPQMKEKLRRKIWELYGSGYTDFYLNCEYGIPLWAAEIICEMKEDNNIGLHIVIPYENQAVKWVEENKERFYNVHSLSDDVRMISTHYYDGCYDDADKYMIDRSDLLLVCGEAGENLYGIKYAAERGIAFETIKRFVLAWDPDFTKVTPEERKRIDDAEASGFISDDEIDWDNLEKYDGEAPAGNVTSTPNENE